MKLEKPDMNPKCADKLFELARDAYTILEWGSGGSTIAMSKIMMGGALIYSVEHDKVFYDMVRGRLGSANVKYMFKPDKNNYVNDPPSDIHYSFVLVDGVHRKECLERAREELSWDRLLLHDAERERYKPWMYEFGDNFSSYFVKNLWICERKSK